MTEHKVTSVDGTAEVNVYQTPPTAALPSGAYGLRITASTPEAGRLQAVVDREGLAELLTGILAEDDSLRTAVRQRLFTRHGKILEDLPPTA